MALSAVNLLKEKGSQKRLETYYESLGFVRDKSRPGRYFSQPISKFLSNCKKFGDFPPIEVPAIVVLDEPEPDRDWETNPKLS